MILEKKVISKSARGKRCPIGLSGMKTKIFFASLTGFVLLLSGCTFLGLSSSPSRSPEEIVEEFYERYLECVENNEITILDSCLEVHLKRPYVTKDNRERIRNFNATFRELDPLICAKNFPQEGFRVGTAALKDGHATLEVTFYYDEEERKVFLSLVAEKGRWKINNIDCSPYLK